MGCIVVFYGIIVVLYGMILVCVQVSSDDYGDLETDANLEMEVQMDI